MDTIAKDNFIERLEKEFGYPKRGAEFVADKILALNPSLKSAFEDWWYTGELPDDEIEGYTVDKLMKEHSMNPVAAILTLDWLLREPERAKASLDRGHDIVKKR
jgi:hypothetical protein